MEILSAEGKLRHKVHFDKTHGVARIEHYDLITVDDAKRLVDGLAEIFKGKTRRLLLDDSSNVSAAKMDKETRAIFDGAGERLKIDKVAVFGADPMTRMMSRIIFTIAGRMDSTKFFKTEDEALEWLKG